MINLPIQIKILAVVTAILTLGLVWHEEWKSSQPKPIVVKRDPQAERVFDPISSQGMQKMGQAFKSGIGKREK